MKDAFPRSSRRQLIGLGSIVLAGFAFRLLPVLSYGDCGDLFMEGDDSSEYHALACNLQSGRGHTLAGSPPYTPNLYRPPGLPVLLSGLYRLTGPTMAIGIALQAVVGTATILLTFFLARQEIGEAEVDGPADVFGYLGGQRHPDARLLDPILAGADAPRVRRMRQIVVMVVLCWVV
jgi:hypothetical protein